MSAKPELVSPAEVDYCPRGWREAPLASAAEIRFSSVDKKSESGEKPVRLCNYTDVYNNDYVTSDMEFMRATATISEIERFGLKVGDVVITKDSETPNDIGVPAVIDSSSSDFVCGYHLALIRPNQDIVDPTFLANQLRDARIVRYFGQQANGSTRYGLSTGSIAAVRLRLPDLAQQRVVSQIIRLIDASIEKASSTIVKLKRVRAGLLHDLLTYGFDDNGEIRDPLKHPEQFRDSPIGAIPKDWDSPTLQSLCIHIGSGVTPRGGQEVYVAKGVLFIRSQNVTFEGLVLDDAAFIPQHIHIGMLRSAVFPNDVLFNITGASIGRCCAMPSGLGTANVNQHVCILRIPQASEADAEFLAAALRSSIGQRQLDALNTCGNRQGLNYQQLGAFTVPWPKPSERFLISQQLARIEARIDSHRVEHSKLCRISLGLKSDLITGRAPVRLTVDGGGAA